MSQAVPMIPTRIRFDDIQRTDSIRSLGSVRPLGQQGPQSAVAAWGVSHGTGRDNSFLFRICKSTHSEAEDMKWEVTNATDPSIQQDRGSMAALEPLLLRAREVAHLLGIGRSKVYEMMGTGELPTVRIGTAVRIPTKALEEWVLKRTGA